MVSTTLWAYTSGEELFPGTELAPSDEGSSFRDLVAFAGLGVFMPIALYSQLLHTGVPVRPVPPQLCTWW